ncbi:MAG TPA: PA14 domain-containing protein, partial [Chthoniobacteraceae bacterium]
MNQLALPRSALLRSSLFGGLLALLLMISPAAAIIDLTGDGLGAIWKLKYDAGTLPPGADSDGDGRTNLEEAIAGTNPLASGSVIAMSSVTMTTDGVQLVWKAVAGKRYQVQSTGQLSSDKWLDEGAPKAGIDGNLTQLCAKSGTGRFYRAVVRDVDSDADGVTDWEELQVGSNPNNSHSAGFAGGDDLARLTTALRAENSVSVEASDAAASEIGLESGAFTFRRAGNLGQITVKYVVSGTAVAGSDYTAITNTVTLGMGINSATVNIVPHTDSVLESPESVIVTLAADDAYQLGSPRVATVLIKDITAANGAGLRGEFRNEVSSGTTRISDTNPAKFAGAPTVTRLDPTVNFTWPTGTVQGTNSPAAGVNTTYYSARWSGEVLPQYSQVYTFYFDINRGGRLWVNGQLLIDNWPPKALSVREH